MLDVKQVIEWTKWKSGKATYITEAPKYKGQTYISSGFYQNSSWDCNTEVMYQLALNSWLWYIYNVQMK